MINKAQGKGYENESCYANMKFQFLGIENIHIMRSSLQKLVEGKDSHYLKGMLKYFVLKWFLILSLGTSVIFSEYSKKYPRYCLEFLAVSLFPGEGSLTAVMFLFCAICSSLWIEKPFYEWLPVRTGEQWIFKAHCSHFGNKCLHSQCKSYNIVSLHYCLLYSIDSTATPVCAFHS